MDTMRVISLNVRGLKNKRKRQCIFNLVKKEKYDLINYKNVTSQQKKKQRSGNYSLQESCFTRVEQQEVLVKQY